MRRNALLTSLVLSVVFAGFLSGSRGTALSQELQEQAAPAAERQVRGRLPAYFSAVVTRKQREEIYRIQARLQDEIDVLRHKIAELETTRSKEVDGVLTAEQLAEINKKRAAAEQRRRSRRRPAVEDPVPASAS